MMKMSQKSYMMFNFESIMSYLGNLLKLTEITVDMISTASSPGLSASYCFYSLKVHLLKSVLLVTEIVYQLYRLVYTLDLSKIVANVNVQNFLTASSLFNETRDWRLEFRRTDCVVITNITKLNKYLVY